MARINWGAAGSRFYEAGLDRGVFYLESFAGVPWNGLVGINEEILNGGARPFYQDGIKVNNLSGREEFGATIESIYPPENFGRCDGTAPIGNGLYVTEQPRLPFSFSYRTLLGNDSDGLALGYKIHIVYNALADPSARQRKTIASGGELQTFSWHVSTLPPVVNDILRPTSHFVVDTRDADPEILEDLEAILYGSDATSPQLPSATDLVEMFTD